MINVALPKGRLGEKVYGLLEKTGYGCSEYDGNSRKLVFRDIKNGVSLFWVKPSDVTVYVELGAADVGVVGKDVLDEARPDVYELMDLKMGKCKMCVAAKQGFKDDFSRPLRVATKYPKSASAYFSSLGRTTDIVKLNGSIELAPVLGISDVIFDIVETGTTLRENDLRVIAEASEISTRLIANKSAYKFRSREIGGLLSKLDEVVNNG